MQRVWYNRIIIGLLENKCENTVFTPTIIVKVRTYGTLTLDLAPQEMPTR